MSQISSKYIIGVVSDTHVPDRVTNLHPGLLPGLKNAGVQLILHGGDICTEPVIEQLKSVAPVIAVQGNRDFLFNRKKNQSRMQTNIHGINIGLMHGHGGFWRYIYEKFEMLFQGYRFANYHRLAIKNFPDADIIIYGHTHFPENRLVNGKLIFNPGSAGLGGWRHPASYGLITICPDRTYAGQILGLGGAKRINGNWIES
jgi:putative phosphoesterase